MIIINTAQELDYDPTEQDYLDYANEQESAKRVRACLSISEEVFIEDMLGYEGEEI